MNDDVNMALMQCCRLAISACVLLAAAIQPGKGAQVLIEVTPVAEQTQEQQVVAFDPASGERRVVQVYRKPWPPLRASMLTQAGVPWPLKQAGGRVSSAATRPVGAAAVLDRRSISGFAGALSPSGRGLAGTAGYRELLIAYDGTDHIVRTTDEWFLTRPFSWSPDERHVAFYFADDDEGDDINTHRHGVALLSVDGSLRILVPSADSVPTPRTTAKDVPVGWSPDSAWVYFTMGLRRDDSDRDKTLGEGVPQAGVYRVNVESREVEKIVAGEFADVAPDGSYVLVDATRESPLYERQPRSFKFSLKTKEKVMLPEGVRRPKISPRGDMFATSQLGDICFYRSSDLSRVRCIPCAHGSGGEWPRDFRWIEQ